MPKKFATENSKSAAARERKQAIKEATVLKKQKEQEDAYWQDDDKSVKKKQLRKDEQDRKREEQLAKKAEAKLLLEKENSALKSGKAPPPSKVTRAQISMNNVKKDTTSTEKVATHIEAPLEENINRLTVEGEEARTIDEAIGILSSNAKDGDKHPEKRMKAAHLAYETRRLNELKLENPSMRLSQLKQLIFKEWQKSPENPLNQEQS